MSTKITSPFAFTGETSVGTVALTFKDGSAEFNGTLSHDARRRLHAHGFTVEGSVDPGFGEPSDERVTEPSDVPAKSDTKAEWVDYGVSQGHARGSLEELTKAEIQSVLEG